MASCKSQGFNTTGELDLGALHSGKKNQQRCRIFRQRQVCSKGFCRKMKISGLSFTLSRFGPGIILRRATFSAELIYLRVFRSSISLNSSINTDFRPIPTSLPANPSSNLLCKGLDYNSCNALLCPSWIFCLCKEEL